MKGIILAGGSGSRLHPLTKVISKQLLPVFDKPMIYYPLSTLLNAGMRDILIISTPHDIGLYERLLGSGKKYGIKLSYKVQESPDGLAQAFILGKEFIGNDDVCLILGDNIFSGNDIHHKIVNGFKFVKNGNATIFGYKVLDPERYGVAEFDDNQNIISLEEKPKKPKSNYAVVGLYVYPNDVVQEVLKIKPSARGELEITSLNQEYLYNKNLRIELLDKDFFWLDTGTHQSLINASNYISTIESRKNIKVGCIEEIVYDKGYIDDNKLKKLIEELGSNEYSNYLSKLL